MRVTRRFTTGKSLMRGVTGRFTMAEFLDARRHTQVTMRGLSIVNTIVKMCTVMYEKHIVKLYGTFPYIAMSGASGVLSLLIDCVATLSLLSRSTSATAALYSTYRHASCTASPIPLPAHTSLPLPTSPGTSSSPLVPTPVKTQRNACQRDRLAYPSLPPNPTASPSAVLLLMCLPGVDRSRCCPSRFQRKRK